MKLTVLKLNKYYYYNNVKLIGVLVEYCASVSYFCTYKSVVFFLQKVTEILTGKKWLLKAFLFLIGNRGEP